MTDVGGQLLNLFIEMNILSIVELYETSAEDISFFVIFFLF